MPAGVRIAAPAPGTSCVDVASLALAAPASGRERVVLATVRARDAASGGVFSLRYRLRLVREDRWYVAAVNTNPQGRVSDAQDRVRYGDDACWRVAAGGAGAARPVTASGSARTSATCSAAGRRACTSGSPAVVALVFLLNRRFADLAVFMVAAVLVGGFVMAPNDIAGVVRDIWQTITGLMAGRW